MSAQYYENQSADQLSGRAAMNDASLLETAKKFLEAGEYCMAAVVLRDTRAAINDYTIGRLAFLHGRFGCASKGDIEGLIEYVEKWNANHNEN